MAVSLELSSLFPTLLQLSPKGKGFGSSFPEGHTRTVRCQKLRLLGRGVAEQGRACLRVPPGSRDNVATRTPGSWRWDCPEL